MVILFRPHSLLPFFTANPTALFCFTVYIFTVKLSKLCGENVAAGPCLQFTSEVRKTNMASLKAYVDLWLRSLCDRSGKKSEERSVCSLYLLFHCSHIASHFSFFFFAPIFYSIHRSTLFCLQLTVEI